MSQTIDTLLADVSPLLPLRKVMDDFMINHYVPDGRNVNDINTQEYVTLTDYSMHAIKHFPAMLQALREALADVQSFNLMARHTYKVHPFTRLESQLEQAIAAASEVGE